jgi:hypothetical protein
MGRIPNNGRIALPEQEFDTESAGGLQFDGKLCVVALRGFLVERLSS